MSADSLTNRYRGYSYQCSPLSSVCADPGPGVGAHDAEFPHPFGSVARHGDAAVAQVKAQEIRVVSARFRQRD
jgi:hypothetical protein